MRVWWMVRAVFARSGFGRGDLDEVVVVFGVEADQEVALWCRFEAASAQVVAIQVGVVLAATCRVTGTDAGIEQMCGSQRDTEQRRSCEATMRVGHAPAPVVSDVDEPDFGRKQSSMFSTRPRFIRSATVEPRNASSVTVG